MSDKPQRKYAMTKVAPGDYLLPSNDGRTIWRIAIYEDGPSHGLEDMPRDRDFWGIYRWTETIREGSYIDLHDWSRWDLYEGGHDTRADAVRSALKLQPGDATC